MTTKTTLGRAKRLACAAVILAVAACGAELKVMTSGGFTAAYLELKTQFEETTGTKVVTLTTSMGTGQDSIPSRIERGEPVDVVIVDDATLDRLIAGGRVVAGTKTKLGLSIIGMAVKAGTPKPDISSIDALKRTLLQAKSIAYSASISGDYLVNELFPRLEISRELATKSKRVVGERVGAVIARGEAEIGFQQVSELLPIVGIDYVGPLPAAAQRTTVFSSGVAAGSNAQDAASKFIAFLASPNSAPVIAKSGLEPSQ